MLTEERFGKGGNKSMDTYPALVKQLGVVHSTWLQAGEDIDLFFSKLETK